MADNSALPQRSDTGRRKTPTAVRIILSVLLDVILTGLVLCIFALFHHVIPRWEAAHSAEAAAVSSTVISAAPVSSSAEIISTAEAEDGRRTEWQIKFADKFTDKVIQTENSYSSPDVSVTVTTYSGEIDGYLNTWHVADVYIGSIDSFRTYVAYNGWTQYSDEDAVTLDLASGAIVSVNGDFCTAQNTTGYMVRNGVSYYSGQTSSDICVLYRDGVMETYAASEYKVEDVEAQEPWQVWRFGPELLDDNGQPLTDFNSSWAISGGNPRTGIGYYEPGHYCLVVADGRLDGYSRGMTLEEFAQLFADLGCTSAYNLDGGASSAMTFNDALYNQQSSYRKLGDTLIIVEPDAAENSTDVEGTK